MNWMNTSFTSWSDFWQMGGYAVFVWASFAVTLILLLLILLEPVWRRQRVLHELRRHYQRQDKLQQRRSERRS